MKSYQASNIRRRDFAVFSDLDPDMTINVRWYYLCGDAVHVEQFVPGSVVVRPYDWSCDGGAEFWNPRRKTNRTKAAVELDESGENEARGAIADAFDEPGDDSQPDGDASSEGAPDKDQRVTAEHCFNLFVFAHHCPPI